MIDFTPMIESVKKQKTRDILISKISDYQSGYNKTVSAYNDNFGGWDGSNFDADYKNKYKNVSDTLSQTSNNARSIIKLLELNKQYFDDEYDEIYNSLVGSSENISSMQENANSYNSFYSQFENAAAFNDYAFKKKYNGKTLSEIDDIIKNFSADGSAAEKRWLLQNRDSFMNTNDIASEIASLEGQSAGIKSDKVMAYFDYAGQVLGSMFGGRNEPVEFDSSAADTEKENNARLQVLKNMLAAKDDFDVEAAYKKADEKNFWDVLTTDYTYADYLNDKDSKNIYGNAVVNQRDEENLQIINDNSELKNDLALYATHVAAGNAGQASSNPFSNIFPGNNRTGYTPPTSAMVEISQKWIDAGYDFYELYDSYKKNYNKEFTQEITDDTSDFIKKNLGNTVLGNVASVGVNVLGGIAALPSAIETGIEDAFSDDIVTLDTNAPEWMLKNVTDSIRDTTSKMISEKNEGIKGEFFNFLYQTGMSMADMGASYLAGGFSPTAYAMIMSSTVATDKIKSVTEDGGSIDEALLSGIVAGALEAIFEKIGIDNLVGAITKGTGTSVLKTFLSSALSEGFEELGTDIANSIADAIINGNNSEFNNAVYAYMNSGYSASAAQAAALTDLAKQFGLSFAGGALSGGVIGGVGGRINKISYNNTIREVGKKINSFGNTAEFIDYAKNAGIDTKKAERLYAKSSFEAQLQKLAEESIIAEQEAAAATNEKYNNDAVNNAIIQTAEKLGIKQRLADSQSNLAVGKIFDSLNSGVNEKINTSVATVAEEMLTESGIDRQSSVELAQLISKAVEGTITKSEYKTLSKNQTAMRTLDDITAASNEIHRAMLNQNFTGLSDNAVRYFDALAPALANGAELSSFTVKKELPKTAEAQKNIMNEKAAEPSIPTIPADADTVLESRESVKNIYGDAGTRTVEHLVKRIDGNEDAIRNLFNEYYVAGSLGETDINNVTQRSGITLAPEIQQEVKNQAFAAGISDYHASSQSARGANAVRKGSVTVSKSVSTQISEEQKTFLDLFAKSLGVEINVVPEIFASGKKAEGKYSDGKLYLSEDVFKGDLWASIFSHELGHHLSEIAPEQWRNYKKFVIENIQSNRQRYASILAKKKIEYRQVQNNILDMEIMDEIACDCLELFLYDAKFTSEMIERDRSFVEKVRDWLKKFIEQLSEAIHSFSNKQSARVLNAVMQQRDNYAEGLTLVNSMLEKGAKTVEQSMSQNAETEGNVKTATSENIETEENVKKIKNTASEDGGKYSFQITQNDIKTLQNIGRKSINDFTSDELHVAEKWAKKFWHELGPKSPFFRAWFGDWRINDTSPVKVVKITNNEYSVKRRLVENNDLSSTANKVSIIVDENVIKDSLHYAQINGDLNATIKLLAHIDEIIQEAIHLDTQVSHKNKANKKGTTTFMHYLYCPVEYNGAPFIAKITVEEYDVGGKRRAYNAQRIKMSSLPRAHFSQLNNEAKTRKIRLQDDEIMISDLLLLVKNHDKNFKPNPASEIINDDGTPKVVYHGSYSNFTIFDNNARKHSKSPKGTHYFTDSEAVGYSYTGYKEQAKIGENSYKGGLYPVYLNIQKPYIIDFNGRIWSEKIDGMDINEHVEHAMNNGYDGVIVKNIIDDGGYGDKNWDEDTPRKEPATDYVVFDSNQIKSATDNIGTFDKNNPDIRYSFAGGNALTADKSLLAEAIELEKNGVDSEDIRQMTGWFRGYDNKWRFEIDDSKFEFNRKGFFTNPDVIRYQELADKFLYGEITDEENAELKTLKKNLEGVKLRPNTLGDYVKHDELFKAYPELKNLKVTLRSDMSSKDHGSYNPQKKEIVLNSAFAQDEEMINRTLIHEIQHSIQDIEGFSGGVGARNPDYARVKGEVEARDVSKRLGFDAEKRKNTRPDIDRTDVVFADDAGVSYSFEESDIEFIEDEIVSEQESVQKANENEMTEVIYNLIKIVKPSQKAIYEVSQKILSNTASRMSAKEFAGKLSQLLDYIENGEADIVSIQNETKELARQVISRSDYTDNFAWEQYKDVRKQILRKTFYVNRSDIGAEDIKQASLLAGRRFYITTDATRRGATVLDIDEVYEDLHNNNPEFFPDTDSPMQQIENISVFLSATSKRVDNPYASGEMGMSEDFATDILAGEIYHTIVTGIIDRSNGIRTVDISKAKDAASRYYKGIDQLKRQAARYSKDYEKFAIEQKNKTIAYRELARKEVADKKAEIMSGAERRQLISSLKRLYKESVNLLLGKRSDRLGTPQELKSALFDVVELVNLQNGMYPGSKYNDRILSMRTRLHNMKETLVNYKNETDANGNAIVSEYAIDTLEALRKSTQNGKKTIDLLSNDDLRNLVNVLQHVKGLVTDANKMFTEDLNADYDKLGNDIINELKEKKNHLGSTNSLKVLMTTNQLMPEYFFERIGGTLENLFRNIYNTEGEQFRILQRFVADASAIAQKHNFNEWGLKETKLEYKTSRGEKINIDLFNVMSLYALYKRERSNFGTISETMHILHGGEIEFTEDLGFWKEATNNGAAFVRNHNSNIKKVQDIQKKFADKGKGDSPTKSYFLSEQDVKHLIGMLGDEQKAFADSMIRYLSNDVAAVGNEASRKMFNHDMFLEKCYFPISVKKTHIATNLDVNDKPTQVVNGSMTKHVSTFADTAIVVRNFMDVWIEHVNQMSVYAATAPALKDFMRVYNYKTKPPVENKTGNVAIDESERQNTKAYSVKALVKEKFGADYTEYIEKLMRDLNGGYRTVNEFGPLINATKKTAVALSLSCAIQQPAAIARAFSVIDIKNFANYSKSGYDEMMKYSAIAQIKATNGYDTLSGPSLLYEIVNHNNDEKFAQTKMFFESVKNRNGKMAWQCFDEFLFYLPKKMDEITWAAIWNSCKKQIRKEGLYKTENEEFFNAVTKAFDNVVRRTQVYDSTFQKSGNLRSKSQLVNMEMAFMSEPTVSWNMLLDAKQKFQAGDKKTATRIVTSVAVSSICAIILKSFIGALRKIEKDDDIEDLLISWFDLSKQNGVSELFGFLPIIKDIYSIFDGYSIERMEFANIERIVNAIDAFDSEEKSMSEKITNFAAALANVFGLPGTTIARGIRTSINVAHNIFHIADEPYTNAMIEATKKGDNQTIAQIYDEQIANGLTKDTILKQYRQAMAKNVSEISEAAQLLARGDESAYYKKCREVIDMGFDYSDVKASIKLLLEEKNSKQNASLLAKVETWVKSSFDFDYIAADIEVPDEYYNPTFSEMVEAVQNGDTSGFTKMYNQLLSDGYTESQIKSNYREAIANEVPEIVTAAEYLQNGETGKYSIEIGKIAESGFALADVKSAVNKYISSNSTGLSEGEKFAGSRISDIGTDVIGSAEVVAEEELFSGAIYDYDMLYETMIEQGINGADYKKMYNYLLDNGTSKKSIDNAMENRAEKTIKKWINAQNSGDYVTYETCLKELTKYYENRDKAIAVVNEYREKQTKLIENYVNASSENKKSEAKEALIKEFGDWHTALKAVEYYKK